MTPDREGVQTLIQKMFILPKIKPVLWPKKSTFKDPETGSKNNRFTALRSRDTTDRQNPPCESEDLDRNTFRTIEVTQSNVGKSQDTSKDMGKSQTTKKNMGKSQTLAKCIGKSKVASIDTRKSQSTPKDITKPQTISKDLRKSQAASKDITEHQTTSKDLRKSQAALKALVNLKHLLKDTGKSQTISKDIGKSQAKPKDTEKSQATQKDTGKSQATSKDTGKSQDQRGLGMFEVPGLSTRGQSGDTDPPLGGGEGPIGEVDVYRSAPQLVNALKTIIKLNR